MTIGTGSAKEMESMPTQEQTLILLLGVGGVILNLAIFSQCSSFKWLLSCLAFDD